MAENKKILVVDDESQITRVLRHTLMGHRYDVRTASDAAAAIDTFHDWRPDLMITDLQMPGMDGIELCRLVRSESSMPIIVLSVRDDERVKIKALDLGADDFVTKPFSMEELLARVRAVLRRPSDDKKETATVLTEGDFQIDIESREITVAGRSVHLTPKEFDLLVYLFRNRRKVNTHRAILAAIWGADFANQTEYLRVFVGQVRKKIESDPSKPKYIRTEPWVGYRFDPS
jgi:two-component system KDP operon response regulator KdpE